MRKLDLLVEDEEVFRVAYGTYKSFPVSSLVMMFLREKGTSPTTYFDVLFVTLLDTTLSDWVG